MMRRALVLCMEWSIMPWALMTVGLLHVQAAVVEAAPPPIVLVPGLGGSVLEAKLHRVPPYRDCATDSDWYTIWASLTQALARYDCMNRVLELATDPATGRVSNASGVRVRPRDFGGTGGVEYANAGAPGEPPIPYMDKLVGRLTRAGHIPGVSLRGAPYDFRSAGLPDALDAQYARLRALVEQTVRANGGRRVHLLSHSLGGPFTSLFLNEATVEWRAAHVRSFVMVSAPLMGTPVALEGLISGPMYDWIPQFVPELLVPAVRTFPSMLWLIPRAADGADVWGGANFTFVATPTRNYTLGALRPLIGALNASVLEGSWEAVARRTGPSARDPGIPVLCIFANDTLTDLSIRMADDRFASRGTRTAATWGDGTVSLPSLEACRRWGRVTVRPVRLGGTLAAHTDILRHDAVLDMIVRWTQEGGAVTQAFS